MLNSRKEVTVYQIIAIIGLVTNLIVLSWGIVIATTPSAYYPNGIDQKLKHFYMALGFMILGLIVSLISIFMKG